MSPPPDQALEKRRRFWLRAIWITAACVVILPVLGMVGTVTGMLGAFNEMSNPAATSPEALSEDIGSAIGATAVGLGVSALAAIALVASVVRYVTLPRPSAVAPQR